jgi:hypothetical protein
VDTLDPLVLDRELCRVAHDWRRWRRELARGEGLERDPFEGTGDATRRVTFDAIGERPESDPLKRPLRAWVYRLMEQRINRGALCAVANERAVEQHVVDAPMHERLTLAEMLERALAEGPRRAAWLASYAQSARAHSEAVGLLWERRHEMARRLGLAHFDALDPSAAECARSAEAWLEQSAETAREWRSHELADVIGFGLGTDAARGWPARLSLRTLAEFFRETRLLDGLDLDPGRLPRAIGAASFLRALAGLGRAFSDALEPKALPFVVARDPRGLRRHTLGALFGTLPLSPAFLRRTLDLGAGAIRDERRALARVVLLASRALALRVRLRGPALAGPVALGRELEEQSERTFGAVVPRVLAGSLWRLSVEDGQRFAGLLLATERAQRLCEEHDEDWYRNPRATEQLREEAALPPDVEVVAEELTRGLSALERVLRSALG